MSGFAEQRHKSEVSTKKATKLALGLREGFLPEVLSAEQEDRGCGVSTDAGAYGSRGHPSDLQDFPNGRPGPVADCPPPNELSAAVPNIRSGVTPSLAIPRRANSADNWEHFGVIEPFFKLLPVTTRYVLAELFKESGITATNLAHRRNVTVSAIRPQLARLEKVGLVQHQTDETSRAGRPLHRYELTAVGRALLSASPFAWATAVEFGSRARELSAAASEMRARAVLMNDAFSHFKLESGSS